MTLEIISPEAPLFNGEIASISLPGANGFFQILNNHAPIVSLLKKGVVKINAPSFTFLGEMEGKFSKIDNHNYTLEIKSGIIEMKKNKIILLTE